MTVLCFKSSTRSLLLRRTLKPRNPHSQVSKRHNTDRPQPRDDPTTNAGTSIPVAGTVATLPLWQRLGPLSRALEAYGRAQRNRPYTTQFVSSLVIFSLGDLSAQKISGEDYDPVRTAKAMIIGGGSSIPMYKWLMFLAGHFNYKSQLLSLLTKVTVNQIASTPIFNSYFFGMQALLSGDTLPEIWDHICRTVPISFVNSAKLWPAVTAFSFTFIGPQFRSIFAGCVAIGWQTYLCFLNRAAEEEEAVIRAGSSDDGSSSAAREEVTIRQKCEA